MVKIKDPEEFARRTRAALARHGDALMLQEPAAMAAIETEFIPLAKYAKMSVAQFIRVLARRYAEEQPTEERAHGPTTLRSVPR